MYAFEELHPKKEFINGKSVAYWIGAFIGPLPEQCSTARELASAMSFHYDVEEQAWDEEHIRTAPELLFEKFMPVAPVTLAEAWSPIPLCCDLLGAPKYHGIDTRYDWGRAAFGVFESTYLAEGDYMPESEHDAHAFRLLRYACAKALTCEADVLIVAQQGWSYSHCKESSIPESAIGVMRRVGYVYFDRVAK